MSASPILVHPSQVSRPAGCFHAMIGNGPGRRGVFSLIEKIAPHFRTVLVTGETGTGKELAARADVNLNTVSRYEAGKDVLTGTIVKIEQVLAAEGVSFFYEDATQGPGVRLAPNKGNVVTKTKSRITTKANKARLKKRSQKVP